MTHAEHRDRALLDLELDAGAGAGLAVVLHQAAQHRLALGDVDVVRSVVADQDEAFVEVDRVELGEAAADVRAGP